MWSAGRSFWRRDTLPRLLRRIGESADAKTLLDLAMRYPPDHPAMRQRCDFLLEQLPKLCGAGVPCTARGQAVGMHPRSIPETARRYAMPQELLAAIRENAKVQGGGTKKHWVSEDVFEQFQEAAKGLRERIDKVEPQMQFDAAAARPAAERCPASVALAADVAEQYDRRETRTGHVGFQRPADPRPRFAGRADRGELRKRLAAQIRLLLVDEFQDTDPLQVELVKALCDNEYLRGKLFFVGDYKQSIYRFRGADPGVFRRLRDEIPPAGRLPLSLNFRSQPAILDFVNALFCEELGPDYEPLRPHRPQVSPTPAVEFLVGRRGEGALKGAEVPQAE